MFRQPIKVFLSSTSYDLASYREKVADVIVKLGQVPLSMRDFGASNLSPVDISMERVREAQVFVGLMGFRYGFVNPGFTKSVSELEYETAMQMRETILMYAPDPLHPPQFPGIPSQTDPQQQAFIERVQREHHTFGSYRDPADLPAIVAADLHRELTGGRPYQGIQAYRLGLQALQAGNYTNALYSLEQAVQMLPDDGAVAFLLALALFQGNRPQSFNQLGLIQRVEELLQVAKGRAQWPVHQLGDDARVIAPRRAIYAFWGALKLDFYVAKGFTSPHRQQAELFWREALYYPKDPENFALIFWLQPALATAYLRPFL